MYFATVLRAVLIKYLFKNCCGSLYVVDLVSANSFNINYTLHEIALSLPYKLPAVCGCPRFRPLFWRKTRRDVLSFCCCFKMAEERVSQFALQDGILQLKNKQRLLRVWQFKI